MEALSRIMLEDKQSRLFSLLDNEDRDVLDGINKFMKSNLAKDVDSDFSSTHLAPANIWLDMLSKEVKLKPNKIDKYNKEAIEWLGYFYRKWHFITGEPSFKIVRYLPPLEGIKGFISLHQIEENNAINLIKSRYNQERNSHRKYENKKKKNVLTNNDKKNLILLSYLSKRMLYKLTNDERINKYKYDNDNEWFVNQVTNETLITIKSDVNNLIKNINNIKKPNTQLKNIFVFIEDNGINNIKKLENKVNEISNDNIINNKYMFLYFYINGYLYEINSATEVHLYNMSFFNRDKNIANKELELELMYQEIEKKLEF